MTLRTGYTGWAEKNSRTLYATRRGFSNARSKTFSEIIYRTVFSLCVEFHLNLLIFPDFRSYEANSCQKHFLGQLYFYAWVMALPPGTNHSVRAFLPLQDASPDGVQGHPLPGGHYGGSQLLQSVESLTAALVHCLFQDAPDAVVQRAEIGRVWGPLVLADEDTPFS